MKKLTTVIAIIAITLFGCTKQADQQSAPGKMNGVEFTKKYGIELPFLDYGNQATRGRKPKAESVALTVFTDLTLTENGGVLTTSISPDAEWGGVQRFVDMTTNDGAVSVCNWNWSWSAAPAAMTCNSSATGVYRSWTSDKITYDVHLSQTVPL